MGDSTLPSPLTVASDSTIVTDCGLGRGEPIVASVGEGDLASGTTVLVLNTDARGVSTSPSTRESRFVKTGVVTFVGGGRACIYGP